MKVAIFGANGRLGRALLQVLGKTAVPLFRRDLDITDGQQVLAVMTKIRPEILVNCAAYTNVDKAETEVDECRRVNVEGVANLSHAAAIAGATLVHMSTDYVFSGNASRQVPFQEEDVPRPRGVYAITKYEGEAYAARCPRHFVIRTCGLFGSLGTDDFVTRILRTGCRDGTVSVVADRHCTPTYVRHLAQAILFLIGTRSFGLYHVVNGGETTWFEFASKAVQLAGLEVDVQPISSVARKEIAPRPRYSVLNTDRYHALAGPRVPSWEVAIREYVGELQRKNPDMVRTHT